MDFGAFIGVFAEAGMTIRKARRQERMGMGFSDKNWVCFLSFSRLKIGLSSLLCGFNIIIKIGFVL